MIKRYLKEAALIILAMMFLFYLFEAKEIQTNYLIISSGVIITLLIYFKFFSKLGLFVGILSSIGFSGMYTEVSKNSDNIIQYGFQTEYFMLVSFILIIVGMISLYQKEEKDQVIDIVKEEIDKNKEIII